MYFITLSKGLDYPQIWVPAGVAGTNPLAILRDDYTFQLAGQIFPGRGLLTIPDSFLGVLPEAGSWIITVGPRETSWQEQKTQRGAPTLSSKEKIGPTSCLVQFLDNQYRLPLLFLLLCPASPAHLQRLTRDPASGFGLSLAFLALLS